ncbi:DUF86 domain-containing protein [Pseudothauera lacus]|uniref:DUF86 domain-containing protein n=1 Tax=Pseudothauera lacus TaxID=2136175 RepID=A0A2T4IKA6_9RHOO|nr:DUF86 domain-containing protein [Pseudothauera lacus]
MSRDRTVFLRHVLQCLERIDTYTANGKQAFMDDAKTQDAVIRNLEIIGQAVKDLGTDDLCVRHPAIPWRQIAGLRNVLAHQYLGVDLALVWQVVEDHLSELRQAVATELSSITPKG